MGSEFKQLGQIRPSVTTPVELYANPAAAQVTDIACPAGSASGLNDSWFIMWSANDVTAYGFWFNVDSGGTVPALDTNDFGLTISWQEVAVSSADADTAVATTLSGVINALSDFSTSVSTDTVTVTNAANGRSSPASKAGGVPDMTITVTTNGKLVTTVGQKLVAMNIGAGANVIKIYQDADGTTADTTTQIWTESVAAGASVVIGASSSAPGGIGPLNFHNQGSLYVEAATADEVIFTLNGHETIYE